MEPLPIGTIVNYTGSHYHGRYLITGHQDPSTVTIVGYKAENDGLLSEVLAEAYPDGVAYEIWREGIDRSKFGNRMYMVYQVRRGNLTDTGEREEI